MKNTRGFFNTPVLGTLHREIIPEYPVFEGLLSAMAQDSCSWRPGDTQIWVGYGTDVRLEVSTTTS